MPARKTSSPPPPPEKPSLTKDRGRAEELIQKQIIAGEELLKLPENYQIQTFPDELNKKRRQWSDYTKHLLETLFTTAEVPAEFDIYFGGSWDQDPRKYLRNEIREIQERVESLRSILGRLALFEVVPANEVPPWRRIPTPSTHAVSRDIFVVHGRDEATKQSVARFLEQLELRPIILHEQADKGRTIIEKFEDHSDVGFAVVLLTPDDQGGLRGSGDLTPRARQNVILELGYFVGKLGRERVCALKVDGVEEPSDFQGVLYVPFDGTSTWRLTLAGELKAAGIDVDMNRAL